MKLFRTLVVMCGLIGGAGGAQAAVYLPFSGTIESATLASGIGDYTPVFDALSYSGIAGTNAADQFYITLDLPHFTSDGPNCSAPGSGCGVFSSNGIFTVTDDGSPYSSHTFAQSGDILSFSVINGPEGSISGTIDLDTLAGRISAGVYAGQAFRGDNSATLKTELSVNAVPLPGTAPLFGAALLIVGATGCVVRRRASSRA